MSFLGTDGNKKTKKKKNKIEVSDWKVWKKRCNQKKDTNLKGRTKNNYDDEKIQAGFHNKPPPRELA